MLSRWKSKDKHEKSSKSNVGGKKKRKGRENEEDWQDGSRGDGSVPDGEPARGPGFPRSRGSRREDPRRHTLGGNQHLYVNPHHSDQEHHEMEMPPAYCENPRQHE